MQQQHRKGSLDLSHPSLNLSRQVGNKDPCSSIRFLLPVPLCSQIPIKLYRPQPTELKKDCRRRGRRFKGLSELSR